MTFKAIFLKSPRYIVFHAIGIMLFSLSCQSFAETVNKFSFGKIENKDQARLSGTGSSITFSYEGLRNVFEQLELTFPDFYANSNNPAKKTILLKLNIGNTSYTLRPKSKFKFERCFWKKSSSDQLLNYCAFKPYDDIDTSLLVDAFLSGADLEFQLINAANNMPVYTKVFSNADFSSRWLNSKNISAQYLEQQKELRAKELREKNARKQEETDISTRLEGIPTYMAINTLKGIRDIDYDPDSSIKQRENYLYWAKSFRYQDFECAKEVFPKLRSHAYWGFSGVRGVNIRHIRKFNKYIDYNNISDVHSYKKKVEEQFGEVSVETHAQLCTREEFRDFLHDDLAKSAERNDDKEFFLNFCGGPKAQRAFNNDIKISYVCDDPYILARETYKNCLQSGSTKSDFGIHSSVQDYCECTAKRLSSEMFRLHNDLLASGVLKSKYYGTNAQVQLTVKARRYCDNNATQELPISSGSKKNNKKDETTVANQGSSSSFNSDIQRELKRLGLYQGRIDGVLGGGTKNGVNIFNEQTGQKLSVSRPDELLAALKIGNTQDFSEVKITKSDNKKSEPQGTIIGNTLKESGKVLGDGSVKTFKWFKKKLNIKKKESN